jgi:NAD-dependent SIR2 family protein deacetylase
MSSNTLYSLFLEALRTRSRGKASSRPLRPAVLLDERIDVDLQVGEQGDALLKSAERCDLLLIAGTSLKSKYMMNLVQDITRIVHKAGGAVVLIDIAPINMRKWKSSIDFHLQVDIEQCAERIMAEMDTVSGIHCF